MYLLSHRLYRNLLRYFRQLYRFAEDHPGPQRPLPKNHRSRSHPADPVLFQIVANGNFFTAVRAGSKLIPWRIIKNQYDRLTSNCQVILILQVNPIGFEIKTKPQEGFILVLSGTPSPVTIQPDDRLARESPQKRARLKCRDDGDVHRTTVPGICGACPQAADR